MNIIQHEQFLNNFCMMLAIVLLIAYDKHIRSAGKMMTTKELLQHARVKISNGWTQHAWARNAADVVVDTDHPSACKFCMVGALLNKDATDKVVSDARDILDSICGHTPYFNDADNRTLDEVLTVYDCAISLA